MDNILKTGISLALIFWVFGGSYWVANHPLKENAAPDIGFHSNYENFKLSSHGSFHFAPEKVVQKPPLIKKEKPIFVNQKQPLQKKLIQNQVKKSTPPYKVRKLNLYFPQSTYKLKIVPELKEYFEEVLVYLEKNSKAKVWVIGHTDDKGDRKVNIRLSKYRARAVRDFMFEHGFKKNQIQIDYKGPDEPIDTNETEAGRTRNRRVEVRVIG